MATQQVSGYGTVFGIWNGSVFEELVEVTTISWTGPDRQVIEVALLNPDDENINKLQGLIDPGSLTVNWGYTEAGYQNLQEKLYFRGDQSFQIKLPDTAGGGALEFDGFIKNIPLEFAPDATISGSIEITINGGVTFASVAS